MIAQMMYDNPISSMIVVGLITLFFSGARIERWFKRRDERRFGRLFRGEPLDQSDIMVITGIRAGRTSSVRRQTACPACGKPAGILVTRETPEATPTVTLKCMDPTCPAHKPAPYADRKAGR